MALTEQRKGELYSLGETLLWGLFPVITVLSYASVPPLVSLGWSALFAAAFFCTIVAIRGRWNEFRNPLVWKYALLATLFLGVLLYVFYFIGLTYTTPGNAALIALLGIPTSFLYFNVFRKERIAFSYIVGIACMALGAALVLAPKSSGVNIGDWLILLAACIAPFGNYYSRKAMTVASSETAMFIRSAVSVPFIFLLAALFGASASSAEVLASLPFLLVNGVLLFGLSKMFFLEAIHRIAVTKALALESGAVLVTLSAAWFLLGQAPTPWQLAALVPLLIGVALLTDQITLGAKKATP